MSSPIIRFNIKHEALEPKNPINDYALINLVQINDLIYNNKNKDYRNLVTRSLTWAQISQELEQDGKFPGNLKFPLQKILCVDLEFSGPTKQKPTQVLIFLAESCQKRWKALRERFCVYYRRLQTTGQKPVWNLYDSLTFITPFVGIKEKSAEAEEIGLDSESSQELVNFKEDLFISYVREKRELYDKSHEHFRNSSVRKKKWDEIGKLMDCRGSFCQRRWRTLRDRFVRELRRSKNANSEFNCTSFFNNMLFLIKHIKSKTYSAEINNTEGYEDFTEEFEETVESTKMEFDDSKLETEPSADPIELEPEQCLKEQESVENVPEYLEEEISQDMNEIEEIQEIEEEVEEFEEIEEMVEEQEEEYQLVEMPSIESVVEDQEEEIFKIEDSSEVKAIIIREQSDEVVEECPEQSRSQHPSPAKKRKLETSQTTESMIKKEPIDEDQIFTNMLACMMKKIPSNLKTQVKLKLLHSLAEFEMEHNLC